MKLNKLIALVMAITMALSTSVYANEADNNRTESANKITENSISKVKIDENVFSDELKQEIINIISTSETEDISENLEERLSDYEGNIPLDKIIGNIENQASKTRINGDEPIKVNAILEDSISIDDNTVIDFYSNGFFIVSNTGYVENSKEIRGTSYTKTMYTMYACYGMLGNLLWDSKVQGYFAYDGVNAPTPYLDKAEYYRGTLSIWQVSD